MDVSGDFVSGYPLHAKTNYNLLKPSIRTTNVWKDSFKSSSMSYFGWCVVFVYYFIL